jgi:hypothetical protein
LCFYFKEKKFQGGFFVFGNLVGPLLGLGKGGKRGVLGKKGRGFLLCVR